MALACDSEVAQAQCNEPDSTDTRGNELEFNVAFAQGVQSDDEARAPPDWVGRRERGDR